MKDYTLLLIISWLSLLSVSSGQSQTTFLVTPYSKIDICQAYDDMSIEDRRAIDAVSEVLRSRNYKAASFNAVMREARSQGACDTHNPEKMLSEVLAFAEATYHITVETVVERYDQKTYASINVGLYESIEMQLISYESAQAEGGLTEHPRYIIKRAFEQIANQMLEQISPSNNYPQPRQPQVLLTADIARNLPQSTMQNPDAVAVVIGNAQYQKTKAVSFALNDAALMKLYLVKVLGFREENIFHLENANKSDFELYFGVKNNPRGKLYNSVKPNKSDVFVFYSGHGAPGLQDKNAYFVPSDCDPQYLELGGYPAELLYQNLAKIPARNTTVVIDACFSGVDIFENISPIVIKAKGIRGVPNGMLIASSAEDEVSAWYNEQKQGLLTYFLLKAVHNRNADQNGDAKLSFREVYNYISDQSEGIPYFARRLHGVKQTPLVQGDNLDDIWITYE